MSARRALVTGGSGTLGQAICHRLAADGYHVYLHGHRHARQAAARLSGSAATDAAIEPVSFDLTDPAATHESLQRLLEHGPIQVLINNAGVTADAVLPAMSDQQWHRVLDVSLDGFFHVTRALLLPMIRTRWGRIVNISSVSSQLGNRGQVNYAAAKGALNAATRALALEVATRGITVNAVAPGIIASGMSATHFDARRIQALVPLQRAGQPEEVAALVSFLSSERAAYITGQVLSINGGLYG